jgi:hypothetical protein
MFRLLDGGLMDLEMWKGRHRRGDVCWMMTNGMHHPTVDEGAIDGAWRKSYSL